MVKIWNGKSGYIGRILDNKYHLKTEKLKIYNYKFIFDKSNYNILFKKF